MTIRRHRANGQGVFGFKRHVKSELAKGSPGRRSSGLGLPARRRQISDRGKTAVDDLAKPDALMAGNSAPADHSRDKARLLSDPHEGV